MRKFTILIFTVLLFTNNILASVDISGANGITNGTPYTTLKDAFDAINSQTDQTGKNIIITITGSTTETSSAILNGNATSWTSLTIYPTTTGLSISGNFASPLIDLNGADNVIVDGRVNQIGSKDLIITNTSTSNSAGTSTIRYYNGATTNTIKYCTVKGSSLATASGVIFLSATAPNTGNIIDNNDITCSADANRPLNVIYSAGAANTVTISNNNIYNFFNRGITSYGINLNSSTAACTISGNSFYETNSFVPTLPIGYPFTYLADFTVININSTIAGFTVTGNFIGGSSPNCGTGGTVPVWTKTAGYSNFFTGINISVGTGTPSIVQDNTLKGFAWSNPSAAAWTGINATSGDITIGSSGHPNTIGATTGTGSITITNSASQGGLGGINISGSGFITCDYNTIGSINVFNTDGARSTSFMGIYRANKNASGSISNNSIGSATTPSSIYANSASGSGAQNVQGIWNHGVATTGLTINNNTIANMRNATSNSNLTTQGVVNGIYNDTTANITATGNNVHDLTIANKNSTTNASVSGIVFTAKSLGLINVTNNTVYNLSNTNSTYSGYVSGIYFQGGSDANVCSNNTIYGLSATTSNNDAKIVGLNFNAGTGANVANSNFIHDFSAPNSSTAIIYGIRIETGATTYSNNIVSLGDNFASTVYGIYDTGSASQTCNLLFNTVYIGGSLGLGITNKSYCFYSNDQSNTRNIQNNIFANARTTTSGTSLHYGVYFNYASSTSLTLGYNNYYSSGTGGVLGFYNSADVNILPLISGLDTGSKNNNPSFTTPGGSLATNYQSTITKLIALSGTGITTDYNAATRSITATTMGAWEFAGGNYWKGNISNDWNTAANWTSSTIPSTDDNIIFDLYPDNNCVMEADHSVTNITNASVNHLVINGYKLTIKGAINQISIGKIDGSTNNSTIEFAGGVAQSIPSGTFLNNQVYNLTINNAANVTLNGTLNLLKTLTASSGKLDAFTNSPTFIYGGSSAQTIGSEFLSDKAYNLTIDNTAGVSVNNDYNVTNSLTINNGKQLTIPTAKLLNVSGTITNNAGTSGLIIKADETGATANGSLIFNNLVGNPVLATVEMYDKASIVNPAGSTTSAANYKWQYFGIPLRNLACYPTLSGSYVRRWHHPTAGWVIQRNDSILTPYTGYEIAQPSPKTIQFNGELENSGFSTTLDAKDGTSTAGQYVFSNPFTAAVDITQLNYGSDIENAVYLFNTGSTADWIGTGGSYSPSSNPGQYVVCPKLTAGTGLIPGEIPSMQGFVIKDTSTPGNHSFGIPYSATIKNTAVQRVPNKRNNSAAPKTYTIIDVKGSRYGDRMWLFKESNCTRSFDNGWDGRKMLGLPITPQIFAIEKDGDYQIDVLNDINNTDIAFQAGSQDSIYTITFTHVNMQSHYPQGIYLVDLKLNKTIDITQSGAEYSFVAQTTSNPEKRFKIVTIENSNTATNKITTEKLKVFSSNKTIYIDNLSNSDGDISLFDIQGRLVKFIRFNSNCITNSLLNIPEGLYLVKAQTKLDKVITNIIIR